MPTMIDIQERLIELVAEKQSPVVQAVVEQLIRQNNKAYFSAEQVTTFCQTFNLSLVELALECLPIAACYARVPVSHFFVGAVAIGKSGNFYFGANQEFESDAMQQTVHAEQSAVSHAWIAGETALTDMVVNYTPCGHCRQFMNELNSAKQLKIHLPHSQNNLLHSYLPDAFGPKDLQIDKVLFDPQQNGFEASGDALQQAAISAANLAYAPYSKAVSGVALQCGEQIITGRYAENAAFNPSFLPLQSALNFRRMQGLEGVVISRVILAEKYAVLSHRAMTESLVKNLLNLPLEYVKL
ncbi:cytidine deaminase [Glaesserella parasuis]|nr:cytidine deaminase [Glaesserella parasuis]MDP0403117.1 cytidine deaminase [Glaesserella parasuis]MDP0451130.1 cytidine deaminase [Glaesserella parasuis]MDP0468630.1 cytidine deaminase [Glaesserella parasuis]MDP0477745.1 cytidine deaminase [Glaesserella parasuis]